MQTAPVKVVASAAGEGGRRGRGAPLQQNGNSNCSDAITTTPSSSSSPDGGELMMTPGDVVDNNTTTTTTTTVSVLSSSVYPPRLWPRTRTWWLVRSSSWTHSTSFTTLLALDCMCKFQFFIAKPIVLVFVGLIVFGCEASAILL